MASNVKMMECKSCGAHFDEMLPACPYCGTASIKGAQAEYMDKLEDIRSDVEELSEVPSEVTKKELKKPIKIILWVIALCIAFLGICFAIEVFFGYKPQERDSKADYLWLQENIPTFDELYEKKEYEQLLALFADAVEKKEPINRWEHYHFCSYLEWYYDTVKILDREAEGQELTDADYRTLLYWYYNTPSIMDTSLLTEEERDRIRPYAEAILEDYETRWNFTKEELMMLEKAQNEDGSVSYDDIEPVVALWMERNNK